ncbi:tyrosine-type recombinase/integrase [Microvirga massiliensis]|uniref:tyrosine-type recombinase/integrase n=1 Tax=Microvirga massiliensis TaxID=1033741 RepID=UPI00065FB9DB|nr:tyrosine-type recombinase/integrase [Microvirga massiliensis]
MKQYTTERTKKAFKAKVKNLGGQYCYVDFDRYGNPRVYVWKKVEGKTGPKIRIRASLDDATGFRREVADALDGKTTVVAAVQSEMPIAPPAAPQTWRWLVQKFFRSDEHLGLGSDHYRGTQRSILEATFDEPIKLGSSKKFGDKPIGSLTTQDFEELKKRKLKHVKKEHVDPVTGRKSFHTVTEGHEAANRMLIHCGSVLKFAKKKGLVQTNFAKDAERVASSNPNGHHTVTIEEIEQYRAHHQPGTVARLALELLLYGGPRASDASNLDLRHMRTVGGKSMLVYVQKKNQFKNSVTAFIPVVPTLQEMLDKTPRPDGVTAIVFNQWGKAFTEKGFSNRMKKWFKEASVPHCNAHGMRKACVVRMIMDDHTPFEIMAVTGHRTMKEIERYGRQYLRERAAEAVFDKWHAKHGVAGTADEARMKALMKLLDGVKDKLDNAVLKQVEELLLAA